MNPKLVSNLAALAALALLSLPAFAQVRLKTRTLQPSAQTTAEFSKIVKASVATRQYAVATLSRHISMEEQQSLEAAGLKLLSPLQHLSYRVRVDKQLYTGSFKVPDLTVYLIALAAEDRVEPAIWRGDLAGYNVAAPGAKPANYVLNADGTLTLSVRMHATVTEAETRSLLDKHAVSSRKESDLTWIAVIARTAVAALAAEDRVQWIDAGPLPFLPENDRTRLLLGVDTLQNFNAATGQPLGLAGRNVTVAIFDKGIDETHSDFAGRTDGDPLTHTHATHMAGTVAGSGARSNGTDSWGRNNNGAGHLWRGMAPLARLIDADQFRATDISLHLDYVQNHSMDISLHSYKFAFDGKYDADSQTRDSLMRGGVMSGTTPVPGRLWVTSSGNDGQTPQNVGSFQKGYFALTKQVKNALMVGDWDRDNNRIANTSSLGPAHDGRIKPDVVAPGSGTMSTGYCSSTDTLSYCLQSTGVHAERHNFYRTGFGSSMAAASTAGVVALVLEQYASTYSVNLDQQPPLPSTLRGIMIHTASDRHTTIPWDVGNPDGEVKPGLGPDFVTGWGLIDPQAAVSAVANRRLTESVVAATCHVKTFLFYVPAGTTAPVRVTLAWDDPATEANRPVTDPKLVNDLDVILVAPGGDPMYSWKLDQEIKDSASNVIPDAAQQCGTSVTVARKFVPIADPSTGNDSIPTGGVPIAVRGRDHLNNVEVVDTPGAPTPGIWLAKVIGFDVSQVGPQSFSLIGQNFQPFQIHLTALCPAFPALCKKLAVRVNLCERFPRLCDPRFSFPGQDRVRVQFTDRAQKLILPLDATCHYALNCPPCASNRSCPSYTMELGNPVPALTAGVYSSAGDPVTLTISGSGASRRAKFAATPGETYFAVLAPGPMTRLATDYDIKLRLY